MGTKGERDMSNALDKSPVASSWDMLRRRKVVQWGLTYAAAAWGLLQGVAYLCDTFGWPHYVQQLATLTLVAGLPVAVTLAWYHGDLGRQRVNRTEVVILSLLVLAGTGAVAWWYERAASGELRHEIADEAPVGSTRPVPEDVRLPLPSCHLRIAAQSPATSSSSTACRTTS
jgi:hypothetical protein